MDTKYFDSAMKPMAPATSAEILGKQKQAVMSARARYMILFEKLTLQLLILMSKFVLALPKSMGTLRSVEVIWFKMTSSRLVCIEECKMTQYFPYFLQTPCGSCNNKAKKHYPMSNWKDMAVSLLLVHHFCGDFRILQKGLLIPLPKNLMLVFVPLFKI